MTQYAFGSGTLICKRTDITGTPPCLLGTLQDVSIDFDRKIETLLGEYNMAVPAGGVLSGPGWFPCVCLSCGTVTAVCGLTEIFLP
jgi:hypothetical protein